MDTSDRIVVVARWRARQRDIDELLGLIAALRQQSLDEPCCLGYEAFIQVEEPRVVLLLESYRDSTALEAHRNSPHYRELVQGRILPLLEDRQVELLRAR